VGLFPTCIVYLSAAYIGNTFYELLRSRDYLDAADALDESGFKQFIAENNLKISRENICKVHSMYKRYLDQQITAYTASKKSPFYVSY